MDKEQVHSKSWQLTERDNNVMIDSYYLNHSKSHKCLYSVIEYFFDWTISVGTLFYCNGRLMIVNAGGKEWGEIRDGLAHGLSWCRGRNVVHAYRWSVFVLLRGGCSECSVRWSCYAAFAGSGPLLKRKGLKVVVFFFFWALDLSRVSSSTNMLHLQKHNPIGCNLSNSARLEREELFYISHQQRRPTSVIPDPVDVPISVKSSFSAG